MSDTLESAFEMLFAPLVKPIQDKQKYYGDLIASAITGKHAAKEVEPGVWEHTFTPTPLDDDALKNSPYWNEVFALPASPKQWGEADPFFDNPRINCALARMGQQAVKQHKAEERARKRTRRQRRAAQRRHNRGLR